MPCRRRCQDLRRAAGPARRARIAGYRLSATWLQQPRQTAVRQTVSPHPAEYRASSASPLLNAASSRECLTIHLAIFERIRTVINKVAGTFQNWGSMPVGQRSPMVNLARGLPTAANIRNSACGRPTASSCRQLIMHYPPAMALASAMVPHPAVVNAEITNCPPRCCRWDRAPDVQLHLLDTWPAWPGCAARPTTCAEQGAGRHLLAPFGFGGGGGPASAGEARH